MSIEKAVVNDDLDRADGFMRVAPWAIAGSALILAGAIAAGIALYLQYNSSSDNKPKITSENTRIYGGQR